VTGPAQAGVPAVGEAARLFVTGQRMPGPVPECHDDVCITCSDTAVEVTVLRLTGDQFAVVDTGQGEEEISVALVTARPGDRILVHAGEAIGVLGDDD
jgi:hydrogenase expression/formation protein HypC